jgi:hypothetical protein
VLTIGPQFAVNEGVTVGVPVHLELATLVIVEVLLFNLGHFEA